MKSISKCVKKLKPKKSNSFFLEPKNHEQI